MKILYVIPARGGSKGILKKNIKPLMGKPLICYSIDTARELTTDEHICISTDDDDIIKVVEEYGLKVPFKRPNYLATDTSSANEVLLHAITHYENKGLFYDVVVLLQPTSPLRTAAHIREALSLYDASIDMIVSVKKSHSASVLCTENNNGFLEFCFNNSASRRQDMPLFYEYNGAIYIINIEKLKNKGLSRFSIKKKYLMDEIYSVDIDNSFDWSIAEMLLSIYQRNRI